MSSLSNRNVNNTRSVILASSSSASSLKVQFILKSAIRGILLFKLIWWPISLIPFTKSSASKRLIRCFKLVAVILSLGKIMPTYSCCAVKGLVYIIIIVLFNCLPSSFVECTKLNMRFFCNVCLVSNAKYIFFARF